MSISLSYPGVYIQEVPSGVRTVASVATSITAFVGRTRMGPVEVPTDCFSFGEFIRRFGGLAADFPLTYAVRDFFANGGAQAVIVRLFRPGADEARAAATVVAISPSSRATRAPGAMRSGPVSRTPRTRRPTTRHSMPSPCRSASSAATSSI